ncbi:MAG: prepilin-type N-terminal cleavage/methylation domain-containing protein [Patescibacteria group bacterium]
MKSKGFTLIEMLIVLAIIGILAGIIIVGLGSRRGAARDARRIADLRTTQQALELYYQVNQAYSNPAGCPGTTCGGALETSLTGASIGVKSIPKDPLNDTNFYYNYGVDAGGTPAYQNYTLSARLEDTAHKALNDDVDGTVNGVNCADPIYCVSF